MTTIVVRDGVVAFDSRLSTENGTILSDLFEKARISVRHQCIFTGAGALAEIAAGFRNLENAPAMPWLEEGAHIDWSGMAQDSCITVVTRDGKVYSFQEEGWFEVTGPFHVIGSGSIAALGALHAGASAVEAVEIACKVDSRSGLPVRFLDVSMIPEWEPTIPPAPASLEVVFKTRERPEKKPGKKPAANKRTFAYGR